MLAELSLLPPDPILGLSQKFRDDPRPAKIDLGVGVFRSADGQTPIMRAVVQAEAQLAKSEGTKAYTPADGVPGFGKGLLSLIFGTESSLVDSGRAQLVQTPGGCGALRLAAEMFNRMNIRTLHTSTPTWPNHHPTFGSAGLKTNALPYYDRTQDKVVFNDFKEAASKLGPQDALLLHGPCHNPTGADLTLDQVQAIGELAVERGFFVLVDCAYHGFASSLKDDARMISVLADLVPELIVTYSCSKNFGLYRERTGGIIFVAQKADHALAAKSHALSLARTNYSMPPAHGALLVTSILASTELTEMWAKELAEMAQSVRENRELLVETALQSPVSNRLNFIREQNGMFSLLPISDESVTRIREEHGVYIVNGGRINLCGINKGNVQALIDAFAAVALND